MGEECGRRPSGGLTEIPNERFAQGMSNSEACRMVGINRRTGPRRRFGRTILNTVGEIVQYSPVCSPTPPTPRRPRYLPSPSGPRSRI